MGFSDENDAQAEPCCVSRSTLKFMYECNLNGDCCHARTCHFMQQLNTFMYSIRNYGNSSPFCFSISCSHFPSTSFGFESEIERVVNELSTSVCHSAASSRAFFCLINRALHIVGCLVCFHLKLTEFPFRIFFPVFAARNDICKKWFGKFGVSTSAVEYAFLFAFFIHTFSKRQFEWENNSHTNTKTNTCTRYSMCGEKRICIRSFASNVI